MKLSLKMRTLYPEMGRAEKRAADYLLANSGEIIKLSISELADKCGCGEATIVRFSRRLGLSGYQDLKITLAQESEMEPVAVGAKESDSCTELYKAVSANIGASLELTGRCLTEESLSGAAKLIADARRIAVFGLGNSASIAIDAQHKLLRAGLDAIACTDNHLQAIVASHLSEGDAAIGISHSGSSVDVVEALRIAKESGASTICITAKGKSPIQKYADFSLFTDSDETQVTILALSSRISQLAIVDTLYTYVALHRKDAGAAMAATERALRRTKY